MTTTQAAQIIREYVSKRDSKARNDGMNSESYALRRVGDAVQESDEDLSDDILAGRGPGSESASRRIIRVAKKINAR